VAKKLAPPAMQEVRILADKIKHPILKPVDFDDSDGLSPDEAAVLAVIVNPALRAARDRKKIAAAQLLQAGLLPNPRLSYSLEAPAGAKTGDAVYAYGFGLGWDLRSVITRKAKKEAAEAEAASVDLEVAWKEWQVAQAAKLHLYRTLFADRRLRLTRQIEAERRKGYRVVNQGLKLGEKTSADLAAANNTWQEAKMAVLAAQKEKERQRLALNHALGLPSDRVVTLQENIELSSCREIPSPHRAMEGMSNRRIDLMALKIGYESQEARVRAAIRAQFPRINIGLSIARDTDRLQNAGMGVSIELPLFDRSQGHIALERATREKLLDEYSARLFEARAEVARILADIRSTRAEIDSVGKSLPVLEQLSKSYQEALQSGNADVLSYYRKLDDLYAEQLVALRLREELTELYIALEVATGNYLPATTCGRPASSTRQP
jgi:outer membrane protein TolC